MAASFTSGHFPEHEAHLVHVELREAAQAMHRLQQQWEKVTTATRPTHEYVTATTALHASLSAIERESLLPIAHVDAAKRIDVGPALADLRYAATDLVELTHTAALLPEPLIRSGLLFAPARILTSTMERVHDRHQGRYVAIQLKEGAGLIEAAQQGSSAASHARATLEISMPLPATTEPPTQTLAGQNSRRALEPATTLDGPDLR